MRVAINPSSQDWADNGVNEGKVQHLIGYKLAAEIERRGHQAMVTRSPHDLELECEQMAVFGPDVGISLHNDGAGNVATGFQTLWYDTRDKALRDEVVAAMKAAFPADKSYATYRDDLYVLKHTAFPFVLLEVLNAEREADAKRLLDPAFQDKLVKVLADVLVGPATLFLRVGRYDDKNLDRIQAALVKARGAAFAPSKVTTKAAGTFGGRPVFYRYFGPFGLTLLKRYERVCEDAGVPSEKAVIVPRIV